MFLMPGIFIYLHSATLRKQFPLFLLSFKLFFFRDTGWLAPFSRPLKLPFFLSFSLCIHYILENEPAAGRGSLLTSSLPFS